jgi:hypothetical protein
MRWRVKRVYRARDRGARKWKEGAKRNARRKKARDPPGKLPDFVTRCSCGQEEVRPEGVRLLCHWMCATICAFVGNERPPLFTANRHFVRPPNAERTQLESTYLSSVIARL